LGNPDSLHPMKGFAKEIFSRALSAVDPALRLREALRADGNTLVVRTSEAAVETYHLERFRDIYVIGTGKASASMAQTVEQLLPDKIATGIVTTKYGHGLPLKTIEVIEAGHPVPDANGLHGAERICRLLDDTGPEDLVLFLLSGGGSALLPFPAQGITLEEKQELTQNLLACGADIREINTVRKHISRVKGGWLARRTFPSTMISFILSDVIGDALDVIASGPTVADPTTYAEAAEILRKYDLARKAAPSIKDHLEAGAAGRIEETPKPGDRAFERVRNTLIGTNSLALEAAAALAAAKGFNTLILSSSIAGETREAARFHGAIAREIASYRRPVPKPACILSGGETTVTLRGHGSGGRNQEFALAAALEIAGLKDVVLLSGGTDGTDGPTDAAGAVSDSTTLARASELGLDPKKYLDENNAYPFFERLGDLLITGPTRTNVMDVRIMLIV
jgi:glycerate 2-kinase